MADKQKHGKGKYAYQARMANKKQEQQAVSPQSDNSGIAPVSEIQSNIVKPDIRIAKAPVKVAAVPISIGKVDIVFEMKRIGILAAGMLVLLVLLSVMLK
jgi:hypothetical protein